mmetsp:Transcript_75373/g.125658  ORF Transcript_75373/g.125658 Transcript_75373/m.125658 type:complete len:576 (+) Transcript_75373:49-1776(+)
MSVPFRSLLAGCRFSKRSRPAQAAADPDQLVLPDSAISKTGLGTLNFFADQPAIKTLSYLSAAPATAGSSSRRRRHKRGRGCDESAVAEMPNASAPEPALSEQVVAEANALRRGLRIHAYGHDVPSPVKNADDMASRFSLRPFLARNVLTAGYHELTCVQMQAIPVTFAGRELLACAPTGSGKTAAFLIPMIAKLATKSRPDDRGPRALIIVPTQELARQIHRELIKLSQGGKLRACVLNKRLASAAVGANGFNGRGISRFDLMVSTPLRLVSLLKREAISLHSVAQLVLDEADKLLELGFLEQVDEVISACTHEHLQRSLFSATMMPMVEELADTVLTNPVRVVVGERNAAADTVDQRLIFVGREDGKMVALRQLFKQGVKPPVLIFVQSKERAMQLFHQLVYDNLRVDVIHSDRSQAQRDEVVDHFRLGKVWVLIATELMARGMDFKGVQLVINFDFPQSTVSYIHRIGRTGRAGRPGQAVTLFTEEDADQLRSIANVMKASGCEVPAWMLKLKPMRKDDRRRRSIAPRSRKSISKRAHESPRSNGDPVRKTDGSGESKNKRSSMHVSKRSKQ